MNTNKNTNTYINPNTGELYTGELYTGVNIDTGVNINTDTNANTRQKTDTNELYIDTDTNELYYLLEFHKECERICRHGEMYQNKYIQYVNKLLNKYFTLEEQIQLKLFNFDDKLLHKFAYSHVYGITFDNINKDNLRVFFNMVCYTYVEL
jgi:hypothetical protein